MTGASEMQQHAITEFARVFLREAGSTALAPSRAGVPPSLLNGLAAAELRRLLPLAERRRIGAFFTSHELADELASPLSSLRSDAVIVDPCCGAGDLLLAAMRALGEQVRQGAASAELVGVDIVPDFSKVARMRCELQTRVLGLDLVGRFSSGDGRSSSLLGDATHVLLNPPYAAVPSCKGREWAQGNVNGAADFLARIVTRLRAGVEVSAILPDVLRSGSRYRRWRSFIAERLDIGPPEPQGRFDRWTDVDVFILRGATRATKHRAPGSEWVPTANGPSIGDQFNVSVGPVVDYRSPQEGPAVPYLVAKDFPAWGTVERIDESRRFRGRLHRGPFVVVPRTSRPGDPFRTRAAVVTDPRGIAVENHLLVLSPRSGGISACQSVLTRLGSSEVTEWLDQVICCRHLTVSAVSSIPWANDGGASR